MFHRQASGALAVALCVGCLAPTSAVAALEPGVHIDPGSPAAKEYGVPLWVLRGDASGHQSPEGIPPPPLFGVGIGPPGASGGRAGPRRPANGTGAAGGPRSRRPRPASGGGSVPSAATIAQLTRQGSSASQVGLLVGAVLIGGLALGGAFALGRRAVDR